MKALRIGIIGLGVGRQHLASYRSHSACEVRALCDLDLDRCTQAAGPGERSTTDADDVLYADDIDVVSIASYDQCHAAQVLAAVRQGKHVFVEKPLCQTFDEARAIRAALAERPDVHLSSNLILRTSPRFGALRRMIAEQALGTVYHVEGDYLYGRKHKLVDGWRGRAPHYSVMLGGGVHLVDLLRWLVGDEVVEVAAFGSRLATRDADLACDDTMLGLLRFRSGCVGKISANFACVHPHFHALRVYGTRGTFINGRDEARLFTATAGGPAEDSLPEPYASLHKGRLIPSFIDAVLGRGRPLVSAADVFGTLAVSLALQRAADTGELVSVPEI